MSSKYKKLSPIDHVLIRPEMYVGSVESQQVPMFLYDEQKKKMEWTNATVNHGLLKIIDEIVLNAADNIQNKSKEAMSYITVSLDRETGEIVVENDGAGIPVVVSKEHKTLIPEMIFGHLLTSSNYDNDPDSIAAGRHGYGAKLTNIMSTEFSVFCRSNGKEVTIQWQDHMKKLSPYLVKPTNVSSNVTRIRFRPDFTIFGEKSFTDDMYRVVTKRIMDLAASFPQVQVSLNGESVSFGDFKEYAALYQSEDVKDIDPFVFMGKGCRLAFVPNAAPSVGRRSFSSVNGVVTYSGGSHVTAANEILSHQVDVLAREKKRESEVVVNTGSFVRYFTTIIMLESPQPKFDSQSKVRLVSKVKLPRVPASELGEFLASMPFLSSTATRTVDMLAKEINQLVQPAKRKPLISALTKLVDAAAPSSADGSNPRTLIVTEGDSAKALALNSLSNEQRKYFGVFPLRGKLLNVRNNNITRLKKCKELCELFASLGIEIGKKYNDVKELRYQRLMIMTDQDVDGTHIKGLLISAFESLWPSLLYQNPGFLRIFNTPLIRATTRGKETVSFYSKKEFLEWSAANERVSNECTVKYYKGLGTSTTEEGKDYFRAMDTHVMSVTVTENDRALMDSVFDSDEVQWRKDWLTTRPSLDDVDIDRRQKTLTIPTFFEKELVHFAFAGNLRALPCSVDGLKPSQRKILWACFKRNLTQSTKVAQLSGYISEVSAFHHGEASLQQTIIKMAQDFVGANNVNLLEPEGQFGSRQHLGGDHAAPRYIFTKLSTMARLLFPQEDDELLDHLEDEGKLVEPRFYVPIIPTLLINGSVGIGFGFASTIQAHHPLDVVNIVRRMMKGASASEAIVDLKPWSVGFRGTLRTEPDSSPTPSCASVGAYTTREVRGFTVVRVEELPWDVSIETFRERVAALAENGKVLRIADYSGANHVDADIVVAQGAFKSSRQLESELGLVSNVNTNATVYSPSMILTPLERDLSKIVEWHFEQRLDLYKKRQVRQLTVMKQNLSRLTSLLTFTEKVRGNEVNFRSLTDEGLEHLCVKWKLSRDVDDTFNYILRRPITYFTNTSLEKLTRDIAHVKVSIAALEAKTTNDLWNDDLDAFERTFREKEITVIESSENDRRKAFVAAEVEALRQICPTDVVEYSRVGQAPLNKQPKDKSSQTNKKHPPLNNGGGGGAAGGTPSNDHNKGAMVIRRTASAASGVAAAGAVLAARLLLQAQRVVTSRLPFLLL